MIEATAAIARIDVFYVHEWAVWSITCYDAQGDQIGHSDYAPHKTAAVREARILRDAWVTPETEIRVYTRDFRKFAVK